MEQVPGMLWLAAVMGLLAACAFSFLFYLVFRRPRTANAFDAEPMLHALSEDSAEVSASVEKDAAAEPVTTIEAEKSFDTTSDSDLDLAADATVPDGLDEATDMSDIPLPLPAERDDSDTDAAAVVSAALARLNSSEPDMPTACASAEAVGDWFAAGDGTPEFDDFDPQEDDLILVWDDASGPEPRVLVRRSDDDPAVTQVLMGDVIMAQVRTRANVDHDHVSLMPLSLARTLGWARA